MKEIDLLLKGTELVLTEDELNRVKSTLKELVSYYKPTELEIKGLGAFPTKEKPRVIFLENQEVGSQSLINLQLKIGKELEKKINETVSASVVVRMR